MNKNEERLNKKLAKITGLRGLVFAAGLLTLMGCGRNVVDTTVTQQPTQTIETTVDDPVVDVPVEPTTDVSDNTTVEPVEEHEFADATLVQTGDNNYTLYIDCLDNSNAPELENIVSLDRGGISGTSGMVAVPDNLLAAILTRGAQIDANNITGIDFEKWMDYQFNVNVIVTGRVPCVLTDTPSMYENTWVFERGQLSYNLNAGDTLPSSMCEMSAVLLKDSLNCTNDNITCALTRYYIGPNDWDAVMKECMDATGLTEEEIYSNYDSTYVLSYDVAGIGNAYADCASEVLQYAGDEIIIKHIDASGRNAAFVTYTVYREKTYGSK